MTRDKADRSHVNGFDVERLERRREAVRADPTKGVAQFHVSARWLGRARCRVDDERGGGSIHLGGEGELSAMDALLASLAACDVNTIAMHAALQGLPIEALTIEARGRASMRAFLGVDLAESCGFEEIHYTVHLDAPGATAEQIATLEQMCEQGSPVADCLARKVALDLTFELRASG